MSRMLSIIAVLLAVSVCVHADLPIHCLKHQVVGNWKIEVTEPEPSSTSNAHSCGHSQPDDPKTSWKAGLDGFEPKYSFQIQLNDDFTAQMIEGGKPTSLGKWTMIYDEGLDIVFDNERFTNFFYYYPIGSDKHQSNCGRTTVGWYSNKQDERACWKATKILSDNENAQDLLGQQTDQKYIVDPKYNSNPNKKPTGLNFLQMQSSSSAFKRKARQDDESPTQSDNSNSKFHKDFKDHHEIVNHLNLIETKSWTAKAHSQFASKSLSDLNSMAGRKATRKANRVSAAKYVGEDVSDLPREFSWYNMLGESKQQLGCGSCYLVATLQMLESRLRIKHKEDVSLSIQHPLDCSYYNQGCDGGYPYLVGLFASQYELVPEHCAPYQGQVNKCGVCDTNSLDKVYKVSDFRFVGGAFGNCSERAMMTELINHGPIVVSFEPTNDFMYYHGGVYHSVDADWIQKGLDKPEWEKVDHSVLLYGWGETKNGVKYWILRNSWGPDWGENGDFRIKRGVDESAIESLAEASDPIVVHRNNDV